MSRDTFDSEQYMVDLAATEDDFDAFSVLVFGSHLHDGQIRYERDHNGQVNYLLPGNSWGKTEFIVRFALYRAWFKKGVPHEGFQSWLEASYRSLVASYNYGVAKESWKRIEGYKRNRQQVSVLIASMKQNESELYLTNGAQVDWGSLDNSGKLVEGARYNDIYVDEAGHIPDLASTLDSILYPRTQGVGGIIHLFGTPKEYSDPYLMEVYEKGLNGGDGFHYSQAGSVLENTYWADSEYDRVFANPRFVKGWADCPTGGCTTAPLCWRGRHPILTPMGGQVLLGQFVGAGRLFFNRHFIKRIFEWSDDDPTWEHEGHFAFAPEKGHSYATAFDLGGNKLKRKNKRGSDPTVGFTVDYTTKPWKIVCFDYIEGGDSDWQGKYDLMEQRYLDYRLDYLLIDATGQVDSVSEELERRGVQVDGIIFSGTSNRKLDMLRNLQLCMELDWEGQRGVLRSPLIPQLKAELERYRLPDDDIKQDCVMALAMVCWHIAQNELPEHITDVWF